MKKHHSYTYDARFDDNGGDLEIIVEDNIVFNIGGSQVTLTRDEWRDLVPQMARSMRQLPVINEEDTEDSE